MLKCQNCPKNAVFAIGEEEKKVPLCLDCYVKYQDMQIRLMETHVQQMDMYERHTNYLTEEMAYIAGVPNTGPKFPERRYVIREVKTNLNNISVSNSHIGVLNTGIVQTIDSSLTLLREQANPDLASSVKVLTESVMSSPDLTANQKNEILEILGSLSQEAIVPPDGRKGAVAKALLTQLRELLHGIAELGELWDSAESAFQSIFGLNG